MKYSRPILASVCYGLAIVELLVTGFIAASAGASGGSGAALGIPLVLGYGLGLALLTAGAGQVYDLLGRIAFNTEILRVDAEARIEERAKSAAPGASSVRYIPGING